jgi:hypothetical protein
LQDDDEEGGDEGYYDNDSDDDDDRYSDGDNDDDEDDDDFERAVPGQPCPIDDWGVPYVKRLCRPPAHKEKEEAIASSVSFPLFIVHIALRRGSPKRFARICINRRTFIHWYTHTVIRKRMHTLTLSRAAAASALSGEVRARVLRHCLARAIDHWFRVYHNRHQALKRASMKALGRNCFQKWKNIFR